MSNQVASNKTVKYSQSIYGKHLEYSGTFSAAIIPNDTDSILNPLATISNSIGIQVNVDNYTVLEDMVLLVSYNIRFDASAVGNRRLSYIAIPHTNVTVEDRIAQELVPPITAIGTCLDGTAVLNLSAGDTFVVRALQDSGGNLAFDADQNKIKMIRLS